jgi:hypothetical protein
MTILTFKIGLGWQVMKKFKLQYFCLYISSKSKLIIYTVLVLKKEHGIKFFVYYDDLFLIKHCQPLCFSRFFLSNDKDQLN